MSVAIRDYGSGQDYIGSGIIKRVRVNRGDPNMTVILQIDAMNPLDRKAL